MTADIGTYFILRANEPEITGSFEKALRELRPLGIHFAKEAFRDDLNYEGWLDAYSTLRAQIKSATGREKMIWALDHEGGRVHRLPKPMTNFPYPLNWQERAEEIGNAIGAELHSLGINLVFGPSLDIFSNENNQVIGPRAFGRTAEEVVNHAIPYISKVEEHGVKCVGKHFPGHGDTNEDTHFELPTLMRTKQELLKRETIPFKAAIGGSLSAVMLAHIIFPDLDSALPSSLTPSIANELLREELGFTGLTITDDLDMHAIADNFTPEEIAKAMGVAGIDLAIFNHHPETALQVAEHLPANLEEAAVQQHVERVDALLNTLAHDEPVHLPNDLLAKHAELCGSIDEKFSPKIKEFTGD